MIHDAREPANTSTAPTSIAASSQLQRPQRVPTKNSRNGDIVASTWPNLRLQGPNTPDSRSAAAISSELHRPCPLISHLSWSIDQNNGLLPSSACARASSVQTPVITANPVNVVRCRCGVATAMATSHMKGR
ncbi:hypothetical protein D3C81_864150 [compost metagenome]